MLGIISGVLALLPDDGWKNGNGFTLTSLLPNNGVTPEEMFFLIEEFMLYWGVGTGAKGIGRFWLITGKGLFMRLLLPIPPMFEEDSILFYKTKLSRFWFWSTDPALWMIEVPPIAPNDPIWEAAKLLESRDSLFNTPLTQIPWIYFPLARESIAGPSGFPSLKIP